MVTHNDNGALIRMAGLEPATSYSPSRYSNQAELHPVVDSYRRACPGGSYDQPGRIRTFEIARVQGG
jgi:hypothetical protein